MCEQRHPEPEAVPAPDALPGLAIELADRLAAIDDGAAGVARLEADAAAADAAYLAAAARLTEARCEAAARLDADTDAAQTIAQARALTATHAAQIGSHGVQLLGGHGFVKEFDNERWFRDLRGAGVLEGTLLV